MNLLQNINEVLMPYVEGQPLNDKIKEELGITDDFAGEPKIIINNIQRSLVFVNNCLYYRNKAEILGNSEKLLFSRNSNRFNHVVESFALGVLLSDFQGLNERIRDSFSDMSFSFENYWLLVALLHDYGYFVNALDDPNVEKTITEIGSPISEVVIKNTPIKLKRKVTQVYSPREIYKYCVYRFDETRKDEQNDHGIAGGINAYNRLVDYWITNVTRLLKESQPSLTNIRLRDQHVDKSGQIITEIIYSIDDLHFYKQMCYEIMQHNMWKPCPTKTLTQEQVEEKYKNAGLIELLDKSRKVTINQPLQMLLSLVDTIEFIKKFCVKKEGEIDSRFLPSTIASDIAIKVSPEKIDISFPDLPKRIASKSNPEMEERFSEWKKSILDLDRWINIKTHLEDETHITIESIL